MQSVLDAANKAMTFLEDKMQKTFDSSLGIYDLMDKVNADKAGGE